MVELLAAIGFGAKELFSYNRESYKFDQDQRLEREMLRLEMQVKRFELFREDVRDLVELTVGRMDVYHLVGALFLEFCVSFFCEGRVQANAPPFILALFLLSNACAFVYLLLAVWLSMHASIASHSFGVRLLTRFVRLPIPSPSQIASISSRLADFEAQGVQNMLRLPVLHEGNAWQLPPQDEASAASTAAGGATTNDTSAERPRALAPSPPGTSLAASAAGAQAASAAADAQASTARSNGTGGSPTRPETLLDTGEEAMLRSAAVPGLHVQLFRRLQAKWQCYDAYCRVCMALGVNQILQGLTYYAIVHTLVENRSPSCGYALLVIFQSAALAVAVLDISGLRRRALLAVQAVGTLPATLAALAVHSAERAEDGALDPGEVYSTAPAMFFLQACWLELLLWVAQPSNDDAALPRRFRTVLFLDVFGDGIDPTDAEHRPNPLTPDPVQEQERLLVAERVAAAEASLSVATAALRRWEAAPASLLSEGQHAELQGARVELQVWRRALRGELAWRAATRGMPHDVSYFGEDTIRPWGELSQVEQAEDPFRGCLIGPFEHDMGYETSTYYYDVERVSYVWDAPGAAGVLRLASVTSAVRGLEAALRLLLAMAEGATSEDPAQFDELEIPVRSSTLADIDMVMRGFLSLPRRLIHFGRSRLMNTFADAVPGIELSTPLVQRAVSGGSTEGGQTRVPHHQLAGPFAKHFVPERLPWQVLRGVTRVLQLSWGFVGMMAVLRELGIYRIDYQQHPGDRRLAERPSKPACDPQEAAEWLDFEPLEVTFPHGPFFEAEALSWLGPESASSSSSSLPSPTGEGALLLGSPFANYRLEPATEGGMKRLEPWPPSAAVPGAVAMGPFLAWATQDSSISFAVAEASSHCPGRGEAGAVATLGLAATRGESRTWRYLAGTHLPCWLLETEALHQGPRAEHRCLALAGYDGRRVLVAWTPWQDPCTAPAEAMVRPRFAVPLAEGAVPMALSLRRHGTSSVRLLCLQSDGSIRIWELHGDQVSKDFRARWPLEVQSDFQAMGVAEDIANALLYVTGYGRNGSGSRLLRARLPDVFSGNRSLAT